MTVGNSDENEQRGRNDENRLPEHSQTLPLITEEIVSSHPTPAAEPTEHVATKVIPPNPISHDSRGTQQPMTTPPHMPAGSQTAASSAAASPTAVVEAAEVVEDKKEEKSSEGRISATQLLAGAGAAATSSVIGGQLGVAGTVVGAGVASIVTALAVTLYGRSLDKGKEKIQEVGYKLAPAVKAKIAKNPSGKAASVDPSLAEDSAFAPPEPASGDAERTAASAKDDDSAPTTENAEPQSWWQKLRRKRVLYPLTIGVAAFGIGLGAVVMAENFTEADISPGTSQISRSVSGQSTSDEPVTNDGASDSGTAGDESSSGSGAGSDSGQGASNSGSSTQNGQSASAGETGTEGATSGQSSQGTDSAAGTSDSTGGSTTTDGTDTSSGTTSADGTGSTGDTTGGTDGSSASGGSGSTTGGGSSASGDSSASGTGGSAGGSSGGSAASAEG
ncbi:hypothetical protein SAMN04489752_3426 [Brevibacterium siliguriense]|uniref:Uncharacterized protein n=1 Tax=Brevibacterium siliguriense TaxID=1136497 RepID=A0A1H1XT58_9MICO|nr:hypothetical protein [Brevibacterium siliguriense]SDT12400.1 hypothetical protein SAMN04489752_3426 [Brevibacterium siliguriense]